MTATPTSSQPPTAPAVRTALARLRAQGRQPGSDRLAALHLALPVDAIPALAVDVAGAGLRHRGAEVPLTADVSGDAVSLAQAAHAGDETYLDLDADPANWVKVLRSGQWQIVFGTDLLGLPALMLDPGLGRADAVEAARVLLSYPNLGLPAVLPLPSGMVLVDGDDKAVFVRSVSGAAPVVETRGLVDVDGVRAEVETLLGARDSRTVRLHAEPGSEVVEYVLTLDGGWQALVPATVTEHGAVVGVPRDRIALAVAVDGLPDGFTQVGRSVREGAVAARHDDSGHVVLLRRLG